MVYGNYRAILSRTHDPHDDDPQSVTSSDGSDLASKTGAFLFMHIFNVLPCVITALVLYTY